MAEGLESFTFYPSFYEAINEIPDVETRYELLMAIMEYGNHGREIELKSYVARAIFKTIKPNLDAEKERKVNGKKGGRPSQEKENYSSAKEKTTLSEPAKAIKNENKNENEIKNENKNEIQNENENHKTNNICAPESHDGIALAVSEQQQPKRDLQQQRFDAFWQAYPKKVGKEAARKAWRKVRPSESLCSKIMDAVTAAKASEQWCKQNGQFIPNPATWLNQGRWDDEQIIIPAKEQKTHEEIIRDAQGEWGAIGDWY
jgi:hypothetical protein